MIEGFLSHGVDQAPFPASSRTCEGRQTSLPSSSQREAVPEADRSSSSRYRAERILDFCLSTTEPQVYYQAVQDARKFFQEKLDDLDGEIHQPESSWTAQMN